MEKGEGECEEKAEGKENMVEADGVRRWRKWTKAK